MASRITCKACQQIKPLTEYYESNRTTCKECVRTRVRRNRASKLAYYRAYDAARFRTDPKRRIGIAQYQSTAAGKAAVRRAKENYKDRHPEKRKAHIVLGNAVRDGRVEKPKECSDCGKAPQRRHHLQGHHEDYSKPLEVVWLCVDCHRNRHDSPKRRESA